MEKRAWGILSCAALALAVSVPALAASPKYVTDWPAIPGWAASPLEDVVRWEIMHGYPVQGKPAYWGEFRPQGTITRAEFAAILARALDEHGVGAPPSGFTDASPAAWYAQGLNGLVRAGIVRVADYPGGVLRPNEPITRAELAVWAGRAAARENIAATLPHPGLTDLDGEKYRDEIVLVTRAGIVRGYEDRTFRPAATATRAEAGVTVHRLVVQMNADPPDIAELRRLYAESIAVLTWADRQRDPHMATSGGLGPHLARYDSPAGFAANVDERGFFLDNPVWYAELRHIEERSILLGRTVAITIGGAMHRTRLDDGVWEVDRSWSARGGYHWWRKINGRWVLGSVNLYKTSPGPKPYWELPPFYDPAGYNPAGPKPADIGGTWWGEDGVLVYDPGTNPPETARFGMTNANGLVEKWYASE